MIRSVAPVIIAILVAFGLGLWVSLIYWTVTDIRTRSRDPIVWIFSGVLSALPIGGVVIYLILRPGQTLMDAYLKSLEEEALLQEIEERPVCPGCRLRVDSEYVVCPNCLTKLKAQCLACQRLIELEWTVCPYCATDRKYPVAVSAEQ